MTRIITTGCPHDCGGKCVLRVHIENSKIVKVTTVHDPELRACVRGLYYLDRFNSPDRLKYPMRRTGAKGEGKFERISWDEALDTVANKMKQIKSLYGNSAFYLHCIGGDTGQLHGLMGRIPERLFNMFGGCTTFWSLTSFEGLAFASRYTLGSPKGKLEFAVDANEPDDLLNSRLIILWGFNPKDTIQGTGTFHHLTQAKQAGTRIISIDPVYTDTAKSLNALWIPIKPGSDTAMLAAMAYVIIDQKLENRPYLEKYTVGFDIFKDYILGKKDGIPKTPEWAEKITAVPAPVIEDTARAYATSKPAALIQGFAPGRTAFGEQFHRMAITLEAMTGNIGVQGGSAGNTIGYPVRMGMLPTGENVVKTLVRGDKWADCILLGKAGGYPDIKMMYVVGANPVNQLPNSNKGAEALRKLEFLVVHDHFMTPTAKFADVLLPVTMHWERNDIYTPWLKGRYAIFSPKIAEPMPECKSDLEIFTELARRLGIKNFNPKTEEEWLKDFVQTSEIPDYAEFKKQGSYKFPLKEPWVAFKKQIEDPANNPFPTPSGKIEIYSETLAKMDFASSVYGSYIPPIPQYVPEENASPQLDKYPLRLITPHHKYRAHSTFYNVASLRKLYTHEVWLNLKDAKERDINSGDTVRVFNEVGTILIKAKVTDRIIPGVVAVFQGTWYDPDENGIDRGGCANTLTKDNPSPAGAFAYNAARVQIQKHVHNGGPTGLCYNIV